METGNLKKKDVIVVRKRLLQENNIEDSRKFRLSGMSFWIQTIILYLAMASLCWIVESSCSISFNKDIVYTILLVFCLIFSIYYYFEQNRFIIFLGAILLQLIIFLATKGLFKTGFVSVVNDIIMQLNHTYNGTIDLLNGFEGSKEYVLLCVLFWLTWFVARGMIVSRDNLHFLFIGFPIILASLLVGGDISKVAIVLLAISFQCMTIWSGIRIRRKFWGGLGSNEYIENRKVSGRINSKITLIFLLIMLVTGGIAYILSPVLTNSLKGLSDRVAPIKTEGIRFLQEFVPKISNGKLKFTVEGVGGGGTGGILGELSGTYYSKVETLKLTCTSMPTETIYLKGFVGQDYTGRKWLEGSEDDLLNAMSNQKIKDNVSLYIHNLPFLRMMYALQEGISEIEIEPNYITVERYGDVLSYTYVPYHAYLNENYRISGGDGAVAAQTNYDDTYGWFESNVYEEIMEKWNKEEDKHGILDEIATAYENYVTSYNTKLGDVDLSKLEELCQDKKKEWDDKFYAGMTEQQIEDLTDEKYEDVINFIIRTLWENCTFIDKANKLPKGKDYINYFMFELKEGDSTAFASTAVMMFRIFGIPARYVEGYVAPTHLFSNNGENEYTAVLQDDNAHAWVEIYVPDIGWTYVETTPGFDGTINNMEMPEDETKEDNTENEDVQNEDEAKKEASFSDRAFYWLKSKVVRIVIFLILTILVLITRYILIRKYRRGVLGNTTNKEKVKRIFYSYYDILIFTGFSNKIDVTSSEFLESLIIWYPALQLWEVKRYQDIVLRAHFGQEEITAKEVEFSIRIYEKAVMDGKAKISFIKRPIYNYWRAF